MCEASYQTSVSSIEEARRGWEKETEKSLGSFQNLEEDRLAHIRSNTLIFKSLKIYHFIYIIAIFRDSLWRVANISSLAAVADDLAAEEVRKTLEVCNLEDAISGFIQENASGSKR